MGETFSGPAIRTAHSLEKKKEEKDKHNILDNNTINSKTIIANSFFVIT